MIRGRGRGRGIVSGVNFSSSSVSGLSLWLDSVDQATISHTSGTMSQWNDKSGNSKNVTVATSGTGFITNTRTINGKNAVDLNGTSACMRTSSRIFTAASPRTYVFVTKTDNAQPGTGTARIISERFGGGGLVGTKTTNQFNFLHDYTSTGTFLRRSTVDSTIDTTNPWIGVCMWDGNGATSGLNLYKNGSPEVAYSIDTAGPGTAVSADSAGMSIGASVDTSGTVIANTFYDGLIGEILIWNKVLGQSEINLVGSYLSSKWGIGWSTLTLPTLVEWGDGTDVEWGDGTKITWSVSS